MPSPTLLGYFDHPSQETPAFDPGLNVICPFCARDLERPMMTISLMDDARRERSLFYRSHKACYEESTDREITLIEETLLVAAGEEMRTR